MSNSFVPKSWNPRKSLESDSNYIEANNFVQESFTVVGSQEQIDQLKAVFAHMEYCNGGSNRDIVIHYDGDGAARLSFYDAEGNIIVDYPESLVDTEVKDDGDFETWVGY